MSYRLRIGERAARELEDVADLRGRRKIYNRMLDLENDPVKQGKRLIGPLQSYRSLRVGRYRVLYSIDDENGIVMVELVGRRKGNDRGDVYKVAERLVARGLLSGSS